jgi:flagellar biosynthetic protein FlhB
MPEEDKEQRTEEATEKRRQETREKGRIAQSREVNSAFVLLGAIVIFFFGGPYLLDTLLHYMRGTFLLASTLPLTPVNLQTLTLDAFEGVFRVVGPVMLMILIAGISGNLLQNRGLLFSLEPVKPKFEKLDPIRGFRRFFSKNALGELFKSVLKIVVIGVVAYLTIREEWDHIPILIHQDVIQILSFTTWVSLKIAFRVLLILIVLAVIDYAFQHYMFEESIKMTKQEVRDERKDIEGHPLVKQRIRNAQYQMARRRMLAEVPRAEVVITNPTHLAVALAYEADRMSAPVVVAKGAGYIAEKIKEVAKEHGVPIVEDKPLARILFKTVDIGAAIPMDLYRAVAEILAYVYRLKGKVA